MIGGAESHVALFVSLPLFLTRTFFLVCHTHTHTSFFVSHTHRFFFKRACVRQKKTVREWEKKIGVTETKKRCVCVCDRQKKRRERERKKNGRATFGASNYIARRVCVCDRQEKRCVREREGERQKRPRGFRRLQLYRAPGICVCGRQEKRCAWERGRDKKGTFSFVSHTRRFLKGRVWHKKKLCVSEKKNGVCVRQKKGVWEKKKMAARLSAPPTSTYCTNLAWFSVMLTFAANPTDLVM